MEKGEIFVLSGVVNGKRGHPKTEARKNSVPLIRSVRELLDLYRLRLGNPTTGVMFATEIGTPLCLHNLFTRQIDPILNPCATCNKLGQDDLLIQRILRHANVATTREAYIKIPEPTLTAGMAQLEEGIEATSRKAELMRLEAQNQTAETVN
jgi:integrase